MNRPPRSGDDAKSRFKHLYQASAKGPRFVDVPPLGFLMMDGSGDPNTSHTCARGRTNSRCRRTAPTEEFQEAVQALYTTAYTLKFMLKKSASPVDVPAMPLEGLWWSEDPQGFEMAKKGSWLWTRVISLSQSRCATG